MNNQKIMDVLVGLTMKHFALYTSDELVALRKAVLVFKKLDLLQPHFDKNGKFKEFSDFLFGWEE